jgi:hypothetical protein
VAPKIPASAVTVPAPVVRTEGGSHRLSAGGVDLTIADDGSLRSLLVAGTELLAAPPRLHLWLLRLLHLWLPPRWISKLRLRLRPLSKESLDPRPVQLYRV